MSSTAASHRWHLFSRICAAVLGSYAFTWGFMALGIAAMFAAGMAFHDAEHLSAIIGFLVFLGLFLWAFSARSLWRIWLVLAGGGLLMAGGASLLQRALL
jgi:hypothetical protein